MESSEGGGDDQGSGWLQVKKVWFLFLMHFSQNNHEHDVFTLASIHFGNRLIVIAP